VTVKFGNYAIIRPAVHTFEKEPDWSWDIKPVTAKEELALSQFLSTERVLIAPDGSRIGRPAVALEIALEEVALTFGGTNIPDDAGNLVLKSDASMNEVKAFLLTMPHDMVMELWRAVGEAIPGWGPVISKNPKAS
jgi:hypothetical protein